MTFWHHLVHLALDPLQRKFGVFQDLYNHTNEIDVLIVDHKFDIQFAFLALSSPSIISEVFHDPLTIHDALQSLDHVEWKAPWRKNLNLSKPTKHGLSYHSLQDTYLSHANGCWRGAYTLMVPFAYTNLNLWLMASLRLKNFNILRILTRFSDDILLTPNGSSHHS